MQPTMKIGDEMVMDENESHLYRFLLDCQAAQRATLADAMAAHNEMAARVGRRRAIWRAVVPPRAASRGRRGGGGGHTCAACTIQGRCCTPWPLCPSASTR